MGLAQKHQQNGFVIFVSKNKNGVYKDAFHTGVGDGTTPTFFEEFLNEDEEGKKIIPFIEEKYRKCMSQFFFARIHQI